MFRDLTLRGERGALLLGGFAPVAILRRWTVVKSVDDPDPRWVLSAQVERADAYQCAQRPLTFAAPRNGGYWFFEVLALEFHGVTALAARLGPPVR